MQENRTTINVSNDDFIQFIGEIILKSDKLTLSKKSLRFIQHVKIINDKCETPKTIKSLCQKCPIQKTCTLPCKIFEVDKCDTYDYVVANRELPNDAKTKKETPIIKRKGNKYA